MWKLWSWWRTCPWNRIWKRNSLWSWRRTCSWCRSKSCSCTSSYWSCSYSQLWKCCRIWTWTWSIIRSRIRRNSIRKFISKRKKTMIIIFNQKIYFFNIIYSNLELFSHSICSIDFNDSINIFIDSFFRVFRFIKFINILIIHQFIMHFQGDIFIFINKRK